MEKLLAFYFDDTEYRNLRRTARSLHIPCEAVEAADYSQTLESLAAGRKNPAVSPYNGGVPDKRLLLICGLADKRLDALLAALKKRVCRRITKPSSRRPTADGRCFACS